MNTQPIESQLQSLFDAAGNDFDTAEITLAKRPTLLRYVLKLGWAEVVRIHHSADRRTVKKASIYRPRPRPSADAGQREYVNKLRNSLLTTYTVDGVSLGECSAEQLRYSAGRQRDQAKGHLQNATFEEALAAKLGAGEIVSNLPDSIIEGARHAAFD